jgi:transposase
VLDGYPTKGLGAVRRQRPGPKPNTTRRQQVQTVLTALLAEDRTWTAAQLAAALGEQRIQLSTRQTRRYLQGLDYHWRRTTRTLRHKQDAGKVATARHTLGALKGGRRPGSTRWAGSTSAASVPASR